MEYSFLFPLMQKNYKIDQKNARLIVEKLLASFFTGHGVLLCLSMKKSTSVKSTGCMFLLHTSSQKWLKVLVSLSQLGGVVRTLCVQFLAMTLPGYFWDSWQFLASKLSWDVLTTTQVNSALHPSEVAKSSISFSWGKGGKVTTARCQVTLCDPIWHVFSRSGVVILITNFYILFCCVAIDVSLTAYSRRIFKHKTILTGNISRKNIRQCFIFSVFVRFPSSQLFVLRWY